MTLHRFVSHTIKNNGGRIERLKEEMYWQCVTPGCEHREEETIADS